MLLQIVLLAFSLQLGTSEYHKCPHVHTNGHVVDLKIGDCDQRTTTCKLTNTTIIPFQFDFVSTIPAQSLFYKVTVYEDRKEVPLYLNDENPCDTVQCPVQTGVTNTFKGIATTGAHEVKQGTLRFRAQMSDEQGRVIYCILNALLVTD